MLRGTKPGVNMSVTVFVKIKEFIFLFQNLFMSAGQDKLEKANF